MKKNKRKRQKSSGSGAVGQKKAVPVKKSGVGLLIRLAVVVLVAVPVAMFVINWLAPPLPEDGLTDGVDAVEVPEFTIDYPLDGTLFPPDIASPTFVWTDTASGSDSWAISMEFEDGRSGLDFVSDSQQWAPSENDWSTVKRRTVDQPVKMTIRAVDPKRSADFPMSADVSFGTSKDEVGAPIFYREVNLPFKQASLDPSAHIQWRFGPISSPEQPPVVLDKLLVCGNCHSFSADASVMGMDVDYASDKGSYAICDVEEEVSLSDENIITWSDYKKEDKQKTFGLMSQVSPDGRYVVSTVKDLSVFLAIDDNLAYSQLFFPIQGILCIYDRETGQFTALPGADDPDYVQANASWSPDGKYLVFARSKKYEAVENRVNELGLTQLDEMSQFLTRKEIFKFDLYRIPFNDGKGGQAEPLLGASENGRSNYFTKYSPDGRWIVFCQAEGFMLLQPDSELFIIPSEGGEARRLIANNDGMNSWHSWSPNSRWLVFSSKANGPYTQLFLTHIDESGRSTPPVVLSRFTSPDRAGNIPEFVNAAPDAIKIFHKKFIGDEHYLKSGDEHALVGENERAAQEFRIALEMNPNSVRGHKLLGVLLMSEGKLDEAEQHFRQAVELDSTDAPAYWNLAKVLGLLDQQDESLAMYAKSVELDTAFAASRLDYGIQLIEAGQTEKAIQQFVEAVRLEPENLALYFALGDAYELQGQSVLAGQVFALALQRAPNSVYAMSHLAAAMVADKSSELYDPKRAMDLAQKACELTSYKDPAVLATLSDAFAEIGMKADAISSAEAALQMAEAVGDRALANKIRANIIRYKAQ